MCGIHIMVEEYCRVVSILIRQPTARLSNHPPDFFPKNLFSFFPFFSFLLAYISCDRQIGPLGLLNSIRVSMKQYGTVTSR